MIWTRSDTLALANQRCSVCRGIGLRDGKKQDKLPCKCVLRSIFRICFQRFVECVTVDSTISQVRIERRPGKAGHVTWGRKQEEYIVDFIRMTERTLTPAQYKLFRYHFLLGADYLLCCRKLNIDKGTFFHAVYRIQQKLGMAFRTTEPYALFPLDEYFGGTIKTLSPVRRGSYAEWADQQHLSDRIPIQQAA